MLHQTQWTSVVLLSCISLPFPPDLPFMFLIVAWHTENHQLKAFQFPDSASNVNLHLESGLIRLEPRINLAFINTCIKLSHRTSDISRLILSVSPYSNWLKILSLEF